MITSKIAETKDAPNTADVEKADPASSPGTVTKGDGGGAKPAAEKD